MTTKLCPWCGVEFTPNPRAPNQRFCCRDHTTRFYNEQSKRGRIAMQFAQAWRWRSKDVSPELASFAHSIFCELVSAYNEEDKASGRRPYLVVEDRFEMKWRPGDTMDIP